MDKHSKPKPKVKSKSDGKRSRDAADKTRQSILGATDVPALKIPKLQGPYPPATETAKAPGKKQSFIFSTHLAEFSEICNHFAYFAPPLNESLVFSASHGPTHAMSEDDEPPPLIPHPEEGEYEYSMEESEYYGVAAPPEGTTEEFVFRGGFGRGRPPAPTSTATRHRPILQYPPGQPVEYLGVGEFYDSTFNSDSVQIYDSYQYSGNQGEVEYDFDYESDFEEDEDPECVPPGAPSAFDEELDNIGQVSSSSSNSTPTYSSSVAPAEALLPHTQSLLTAPSASQVQMLLSASRGLSVPNSRVQGPTSISHLIAGPTAVGSQIVASSPSSVAHTVTTQAQPNVLMSASLGPTLTLPTGQNGSVPPSSAAAAVPLAPNMAANNPAAPAVDPPVSAVHPMLRSYQIKDKEMVSPDVEPSLAAIVDDYYKRAATDVASLELKETYEALLRPSNVSSLIKTELNPELKQKQGGISKAALVKDGSGRGVQNALVRAGVALTLIANEILLPNDKNSPDLAKILNLCMQGLKCTAYGVQRVNALRRLLLRPQLAYCYQSLCDEVTEQLQFLLPPDLPAYMRAEAERQKVATPLTKSAQKRKSRKKNRGGRNGRGNHGNQGPPRHVQQQQQPFQPHFYPQQQHFGKCSSSCSTKPAYKRKNKLFTTHESWLQHYQKIQKLTAKSDSKINKIELQGMITDSLTQARKQKMSQVPYNFDLPVFHFSTESRSGQFPWQPERSESWPSPEPERQGPRPQLTLQSNSKVNIDPLNLPNKILEINGTFHAGSLKQNITTWRQITGDPEILKLISGIGLNFKSPPFQEKLPHEIQFSGDFQVLVQKEIKKFLDQGIIEPTTFQPGDYVSNLFARPKKTPGEIRLILNLKHLNMFVPTVHFKMESLDMALKLLRPNMYMASIDLTNSFYHLLVKEKDRKFLKFSCLGQTYRFSSLPMGFKHSPLWFTKIMKIPLAFLRKHYHCIIICYIDDLLILGYTKDEVHNSVAYVANLLQILGFHINREKSELDPTQKIEFLGFILDSVNMTISLTPAKIAKIKSLASQVLEQQVFTIRFLAQFLGNCVASFPAVEYGPYHTKEIEISKIQALKDSHWDFESFMSLSEWAIPHVQWWHDNIELPQVHKLSLLAPPNNEQIHLFTDASKTGWGVYFPLTGEKTGGLWSPEEQKLHINAQELAGVYFGALLFLKNIKNHTVHLHTDNQVALFALRTQGSTRSPWCNKYTAKIMQLFEQNNLHLIVSYVRSEHNVQADAASRIYQHDLEWSIPDHIFKLACKQWGTPQIDLFASRINYKVPKYCSWKPDPSAFAINAFSVDWSDFDLIYVFPPFSLIPRALQYLQNQQPRPRCLFVAPWWTTQPWWPILNRLQRAAPIQFNSQDLQLHHAPEKQHHLKFRLLLCLL